MSLEDRLNRARAARAAFVARCERDGECYNNLGEWRAFVDAFFNAPVYNVGRIVIMAVLAIVSLWLTASDMNAFSTVFSR
jgi:hypothetical protein